jgi:hypothetical protein
MSTKPSALIVSLGKGCSLSKTNNNHLANDMQLIVLFGLPFLT